MDNKNINTSNLRRLYNAVPLEVFFKRNLSDSDYDKLKSEIDVIIPTAIIERTGPNSVVVIVRSAIWGLARKFFLGAALRYNVPGFELEKMEENLFLYLEK